MKNLFSTCTCLVLAACSTAVLAGGPEVVQVQPQINYFDGLSIGLHGSYNQTTFQTNTNASLDDELNFTGLNNPTIDITTRTKNLDDDLTNYSFWGGIHADYGRVFGHNLYGFGNFYAGIEAYADFGSSEETDNDVKTYPAGDPAYVIPFVFPNGKALPATTETVSTAVKLQNGYGAAFKPGILLTPKTLFYGKVGFMYSKEDVDTTYTVNNNATGQDLNNTSSSNNQYVTGVLWGVGVDQFVADNWSINAEFQQVRYPSVSNDNETTDGATTNVRTPGIFFPRIPLTVTNQASAQTNVDDTVVSKLLVGVTYHF